MYINFDKMPDDSRVWVLQAQRKLTEWEAIAFFQEGANFLLDRTDIMGSVKVIKNRFIVIAVNNEASDNEKTVRSIFQKMRELEAIYRIPLFNRDVVLAGKEEEEMISLSKVREMVEEEELSNDTLIYNHNITTKKDLQTRWIVPVSNSWLNSFFATLIAA